MGEFEAFIDLARVHGTEIKAKALSRFETHTWTGRSRCAATIIIAMLMTKNYVMVNMGTRLHLHVSLNGNWRRFQSFTIENSCRVSQYTFIASELYRAEIVSSHRQSHTRP